MRMPIITFMRFALRIKSILNETSRREERVYVFWVKWNATGDHAVGDIFSGLVLQSTHVLLYLRHLLYFVFKGLLAYPCFRLSGLSACAASCVGTGVRIWGHRRTYGKALQRGMPMLIRVCTLVGQRRGSAGQVTSKVCSQPPSGTAGGKKAVSMAMEAAG